MKLIPFAMILVIAFPAFAEWTPPENPDPHAILQEAKADARAKRYEDALAKHVWFHQNALTFQPALYGVRLSFALEYWMDLGKSYPPAIVKLKSIRDDARRKVLDANLKSVNEPFHDFVSINRALDEEPKSKELFVQLDQDKPALAKEVFDLARPSLINAKAYQLCGKYLEPRSIFDKSKEQFNYYQQPAEDAKVGDRQRQFGESKFTNEVTTLVALLILNDRKVEAQRFADEAKKEWNNAAFHMALDQALKGIVPKPWP
ncbi:MAG TPA: hypothetical protein VGM98_12570 [Schlesneria sp.]|jgi:hypothetical protein